MMRWFRSLWGRSDRDYQEEINEHIELETRANIDRGMSPEEARRTATLVFGNTRSVREALQEGRTAYGIATLGQDIRYGLRTIRRNPILTCVVALTLSVGIGITSGVFSLVDLLVFVPDVREPANFARVYKHDSKIQDLIAFTTAEYAALRDQSRSMRELAAWTRSPVSARIGPDGSEKVWGMLVTCNLFSVFRVTPPTIGRYFQSEDCTSNQPVAVISEILWAELENDKDIVGRSILFGDVPITVVGVTSFEGSGLDFSPYIWFPYTLQPRLQKMSFEPRGNLLGASGVAWLELAGRLNEGFTLKTAANEFRIISERDAIKADGPAPTIRVTNGSAWAAGLIPAWQLLILLGLPTLVTFIACVNVAILLLSRAAARRQEMAVRLSLGASRLRLIRMLLVETFLLTLLAAVVSVLLVFIMPTFLQRFVLQAEGGPLFLTPAWRVFAYLAATTILATFVSGLTPALESLNLRLSESLKGRQPVGGYRGSSRIRSLLVGIQVALSMVPLVGAAMAVRAEQRLLHPGFDARQIVGVEIPEELKGPEPLASIAASIAVLPGVTSVAVSEGYPMITEGSMTLSAPLEMFVRSTAVSPSYFETMGIPIIAGRSFEKGDAALQGLKPVVVSQQFVRRVFNGMNPLGKILSTKSDRMEIVGVARDRASESPFMVVEGSDDSLVYSLMAPPYRGILLARFKGDFGSIMPAIQSVVKDKTGSMDGISSLATEINNGRMTSRRVGILFVLLGGIALSLALMGVFGVVSFAANQRKKEVAIRLALGASRREILWSVVSAGYRPVPFGVAVGLFISWGGYRLAEAQSMLPTGLLPKDPIPYLVVVGLLLISTTLAMLVPAHRATSQDPVNELREE